MGGIVDHEHENLAISDLMITRTRRRILRAVQAHVEGIVPPGVDNPETYQGARGGDFASSASLDWLRAYSDEMRASKQSDRRAAHRGGVGQANWSLTRHARARCQAPRAG